MKNKISIIATLALFLTMALVAFSVEAIDREGKGNNLEIENQLNAEVSNQGEEAELEVQNQGQIQVGNNVESSVKVNIKRENKSEDEKLDDDSDDDGLESVDSDEDDLGDDSNRGMKNEKEDKNKTEEERNMIRDEHRSAVSLAVSAMLQVAEKHEGIGEQVRVIAQNQVKTQEEVEVKLANIEDRGAFAKFLIGAKYSDIKDAEKLLEQNREQIRELNQIKLEISNQSDVAVLDQQIQVLENVNLEIENSLKASQEGFSLFGWAVKIFSK